MSDETNPSETLSSLRTSLVSVEETLKPLLEKKWAETTGSLGTLERAKLDVLVSYAINDLIWVYLKMKGVDPSTHDVSAELERISSYYGKVKAVEEPESRRTTQIDKAAAGRLISASIPKRQRLPADASAPTTSGAALARKQAEAAVNENVGTSSRFRHIAKDEDTERITPLAQAGDEDEEEDEDEIDDVAEDEEEDGDEAEDLLNDLQEQYLASNGQSGDLGSEQDLDRKKRKRAEDLNR